MKTAARGLLDCSRRGTLAFWFVSGAVLGITVMSAYGSGHWSSLLHVGSRNPLLNQIEGELGPVPTSDEIGHDGQLYYLIARDPSGAGDTPNALAQFDDNGSRYRYRRILFPLLAGGFGQFSGWATLCGMIIWLAVATGMATVALADLCFQLNVRGEAVLAAAFNAGALLSLLLLTPDALALALALAGVSLTLRARTGWAIIAFALAALTKEVYLLVPWALAAWTWQHRNHRTALSLAVLPALPIVVWSGWVVLSLPGAPAAVENVGFPLVGLVEATSTWLRGERNPLELMLATSVVLTFVTAGVMAALNRGSVLCWLAVPWLVLGAFSTLEVWGKPNNAVRVFAILWPLSVLLVGDWLSERTRRPAESTW